MTDRLLRMPPVPVYDPAKDGNPFMWIQDTAPKVKAARLAAALEHRWQRQPLPPLREKAGA